MFYELTTPSCPLLLVGDAARRAAAWFGQTSKCGEILGCWRTELGPLGRVLLLRSFETAECMTAERERVLLSREPFGSGDVVTAFGMASYSPFPFLPAVRTGRRGAVYEFHTYRLKPGDLPPTLAGWRDAVVNAHAYAEHLVTNMYALDGAPRITHIRAFESLEERGRLRASAYNAGVWPPKFGPDQILEATSVIGLPEAFSQLR
ncbi:NIPSNAP family protein [Acidiphilium sp.]|uniref:NIPSNAP family protein n=1 Tax=Acidiphilium sp. TaxID=527 RepID=UPI003CFEBB2F